MLNVLLNRSKEWNELSMEIKIKLTKCDPHLLAKLQPCTNLKILFIYERFVQIFHKIAFSICKGISRHFTVKKRMHAYRFKNN